MQHEQHLLDYIAAGGKLDAPENATARYRGELMRLMAVFVDSEMAGAAGFADCINMAPGLRERQIGARIVLEKFAHAEQVLTLMETFGANTRRYAIVHPWEQRLGRETDLGTQRVDGDMRLNVFHYPMINWLDAVIMNTLMGHASVIQLDELSACSYQPLADAMQRIVPLEQRHAQRGLAGLRKVLDDGASHAQAQELVYYWFPRVAASFGRSDSGHLQAFRRYGLRQRSNEALLAHWQEQMIGILGKLELAVPVGER